MALTVQLICPHCAHPASRVIESRGVAAHNHIWRRRECKGCGERFTSFEVTDVRYEELSAKGAELDHLMHTLRTALLKETLS